MCATMDQCIGTIGGGMMEYKLVELCRAMMQRDDAYVLLKTQYHDKVHPVDQSGMICSGMQRVALIPLTHAHTGVVLEILACVQQGQSGTLKITPDGLSFDALQNTRDEFIYDNDTAWHYREVLGRKPLLHIVGAGHVSLALSEIMTRLGFDVWIYDDRPHLNTLAANTFAVQKIVTDYTSIGDLIAVDPQDYVVIMTIGYRDDKIVLQQLIDKPCRYLGMLGSAEKVRTLFNELRAEGMPEVLLGRVHAPIGLDIGSCTADEIAVSIAAQIIREKNNPGSR